MISHPNARRERLPMPAIAINLHLPSHAECDHTPCSFCHGRRIVKGNRDIERSSAWLYVPLPQARRAA